MKTKDVTLNAVYVVKVSQQLAPVVLTTEHPNGGWFGTNMVTGRQVRIKTAAKLRRPLKLEEVEGIQWRHVDALLTVKRTVAAFLQTFGQ